MRLAIYGAGKLGRQCKPYMEIDHNYRIECFIDKVIDEVIDGVTVINSIDSMPEVDDVLIAVKDIFEYEHILMELWSFGIKKVLLFEHILLFQKYDDSIPENLLRDVKVWDISWKALLSKLEYHVCDICNLNCRGCSHFAPIYSGTNAFSDPIEFEKDCERLSQLFTTIIRFRLMGGEPFLHKDIGKFITIVKRYFPKSNLEIVTNGLLLCGGGVSDKVWSVVRNNDVRLCISLYPPTYQIREKIRFFLDEHEIQYEFVRGLKQDNDEGIINEFHKNLTTVNQHNPYKAVKNCMGSVCHFLRKSKLAKCAIPLLAEDVNRFFHTKYTICDLDYIDIFNDKIEPWSIVRRLNQAMPFCGYCIEGDPERFEWEAGKMIELSDYIVG